MYDHFHLPGVCREEQLLGAFEVELGIIAYLDGEAVAVERSLKVLVKARSLQRPVLLLRGEEEAGRIGQRQSLPRGVKQSLLTPEIRTSGCDGHSERVAALERFGFIQLNTVTGMFATLEYIRKPVNYYVWVSAPLVKLSAELGARLKGFGSFSATRKSTEDRG